MSESYRQCMECGKRALNFATRCPGCGVALPDPAPFGEDAPQLNWTHSFRGVIAVSAIAGLIVSLNRGSVRPVSLRAETSFAKPATIQEPPLAEARPLVLAEAQEMVEAPPAIPRLPEATPRRDTVTVVEQSRRETVTVVAPLPGRRPLRLIAKQWTYVRSQRNANSALKVVLTHRETVAADSLINGWYRVALHGEVLGYAKETTLEPKQP